MARRARISERGLAVACVLAGALEIVNAVWRNGPFSSTLQA